MMATAEEIMQSINPIKSSKSYENQWEDFVKFSGIINEEPEEEHFIKYFHHLGEVRKYASSSLWSKYSMINHKYQTLYGHKLQKFPRVTLLLKKFEAGYKRKTASVFTKEQIMQFLNDAPNDGEYVHMKAAVVLAYFGGLRCADLVELKCEDLEFNETTGMWVTYAVSKQRGESTCINNKFNIPLEFCSYLEKYDNALDLCQAGSGRLMKSYRLNKNGVGFYTKQPMGRNLLAKFTLKMTQFLDLSHPETYTGHAIRRSSASMMAEAGASSLKKHFNWKSEATSLKYIENSEKGKRDISNMLLSSNDSENPGSGTKKTKTNDSNTVINFTNCQNVIINL